MTVTLRCAVDPSDPADDSRDPRTCVRPAHFLRSQLGRALLFQLHGEPKLAALELGAIEQGTVAQAIDVLTEATAVALSQLNQRAEYPIPIHHVVDRLQAVGAADLDVSIELLHRAVLANAGAHLPVEELIHTYGPGSALYGAFDATAAVIRFAGQRRWRRTAEILTELGFGELRSGDGQDSGGGGDGVDADVGENEGGAAFPGPGGQQVQGHGGRSGAAGGSCRQ